MWTGGGNESEVTLVVTYVSSEGSLLRISGVYSDVNARTLENHLAEAASRIVSSPPPPMQHLRLGLVVAVCQGRRPRRAVLLSVVPLRARFIDDGEESLINVVDIRLLESAPDAIRATPPQAIDVLLARIAYPDHSWEHNALSYVRDILLGKNIVCRVEFRAGERPFAGIRYQNSDLSEFLIQSGLGMRMDVRAQSRLLEGVVGEGRVRPQTSNLQTKLAKNVSTPRPLNRFDDRFVDRSYGPTESAPLTYKSRLLELHSQHEVRISFAKEGPELFAIRLKNDEPMLESMMNQIRSVQLKRFTEPPMIGTVCLGKQSENNTVCRAVVTGLTTSKCRLFFVDFGITELVPYFDIYYIPKELVTPSVFALRFCLSGVKDLIVTEEVKESFNMLVNDKILTLKVVPPEGPPLIQYGELFLNGRSVKEILKSSDPSVIKFEKLNVSALKGCLKVIVSYVDSCTNFFVQLWNYNRNLENVMSQVQEHCQNASSLRFHEISHGMACCALYPDDDKWYRAQVLNIKRDKIIIVYVDYGNEQEVTTDLIKPIAPALLKLETQAIRCALRGYENLPFNAKLSSKLEELTVETELMMNVCGLIGSGVLLVDLINESGSPSNIADCLTQFMHEVHQSPPPQTEIEVPVKDYDSSLPSEESQNQNNSFDDMPINNRNQYFKHDKQRNQSYGTSGYNHDYRKPKPKSVNDRLMVHNEGTNENGDFNNDQVFVNEYRRNSKENIKKSSQQSHKKKDRSTTNTSNDVSTDTRPTKNNKTQFKQNKGQIDKKHNVSSGFAKQNHRNENFVSSKGLSRKFNTNFVRNKPVEENSFTSTTVKYLNDPAPLDARFAEYEPSNTEKVQISWFISPDNFYVQILSLRSEFNEMMNRIPIIYENIRPISKSLSNGTSVVAQYPIDNALFRAEIVEMKNQNCYLVHFVDYGNQCVVNANKIWALDNELLKLPKLALKCSLNNVSPINENWSKNFKEDIFFSENEYDCNFISKGFDCHIVSLHGSNYPNVDEALVNANLAVFGNTEMIPKYAAEPVDLKIIVGQTFYCKICQVESMAKFFLCIDPVADTVDNMFEKYSTNKPLESMLHNFDHNSSTILLKEGEFKSLENCFVFAYIDDICDNKLLVTLYDCIEGLKMNCFTPDDGAYDSIPVICPHPVFNTDFGSSFTSHLESLNEIYLQRNKNTDIIYKLLQMMFNFYDKNDNAQELVPMDIDYLCAAKSNDGNWYRAKIAQILPDECEVFYVDYGNKEVLPKNCIKVLDPKFNVFYEQAICCVLGIQSRDTSVINTLKEIIDEQELQVKLVSSEMGWLSNLSLDGVNIVDKLDNVKLSDNNIDEKDDNIKENLISVIVSHIDSPGQFWLQMSSNSDKIQELNSKLQEETNNFEDLSDYEIGKTCIAKYTADESYYRAVILDCDSDIITVRFTDFGNTDVLDNSSGNLKCLPQEWAEIQPYSIKCSVNAIPTGMGEWTEQATSFFTQAVKDKDTPIEATIILRDITTYVDLYVENSNITEKLVKAGYATLVDNQNNGELPTGFTSHINSPSEFWIQLESSANDLKLVDEQLINAEEFPPVTEIEEEVICAAKFPEDNFWYRAKIIIHGSDGTEVLFMDYGNASLTNDLRSLPENLKNMPALSRKCALQKPSNIKSWSSEAESKFAELAADGATVFQVSFIASGDISIVELYLDNKPITQELVALCMAQNNDTFLQPPLQSNNIIPVRLSYLQNSNRFWIQHESNLDQLASIVEDLSNVEKYETLTEPMEKDLCISLSFEDSKWYRSKIISVNESEIQVLHIDYGITGITNSIKIIPEHIKKIPSCAILCTLQPPTDDGDYEKLKVLFNEQSQVYVEILDSSDEINTVNLYIKENDQFVNFINSRNSDTECEQKNNTIDSINDESIKIEFSNNCKNEEYSKIKEQNDYENDHNNDKIIEKEFSTDYEEVKNENVEQNVYENGVNQSIEKESSNDYEEMDNEYDEQNQVATQFDDMEMSKTLDLVSDCLDEIYFDNQKSENTIEENTNENGSDKIKPVDESQISTLSDSSENNKLSEEIVIQKNRSNEEVIEDALEIQTTKDDTATEENTIQNCVLSNSTDKVTDVTNVVNDVTNVVTDMVTDVTDVKENAECEKKEAQSDVINEMKNEVINVEAKNGS